MSPLSIEQANDALPVVRAIVKDIVELYADVHDRRDHLARLRMVTSPPQHPMNTSNINLLADDVTIQQMEADLDDEIERLQEYIAELNCTGAELKDPISGIVTFQCRQADDEVNLTWRLGDDAVRRDEKTDGRMTTSQSTAEQLTTGV